MKFDVILRYKEKLVSRISEKTIKLLWGNSGNKCAICKQELSISKKDKVYGEQAHIISEKEGGPRHDPLYRDYDDYDNLILVCANHHTEIDKDIQKYTVEKLKSIKADHEKWVKDTLSKSNDKSCSQISWVPRIKTGKELMRILQNVHLTISDYSEPLTENELELFVDFFQNITDIVDIYSDLNIGDTIKIAFDLNAEIKKIEESGYYVFGEAKVYRGIKNLLLLIRKNNDENIQQSPVDNNYYLFAYYTVHSF